MVSYDRLLHYQCLFFFFFFKYVQCGISWSRENDRKRRLFGSLFILSVEQTNPSKARAIPQDPWQHILKSKIMPVQAS